MTESRDRSRSLLRLALPGLLLFGAVQALLLARVWLAGPGSFSGPDPYMRLARVLECRGGPGCPEGLFLRSNTPYGEVLHWPFLMDWLILLLAAPLRLFMGFRQAVVAAGYAVGPLLGIAALMVLTAVARRLADDRTARWATLLAATLYWALYAFAPVRPDHHGLLAALFLGGLSGTLALVRGGEDSRGWVTAGVTMGLAVWVSTEGLVAAIPLLAALGVAWVVRGDGRTTRAVAATWSCLLAIALLGVLVDGPKPEPWAVEFDRLSIVYVTALAIGTAFFTSMLRWTPARPGARSALAGGGALAGGVLLVLLFPGIRRGPMAAVHPDMFPLYLDRTAEFMSALSLGSVTWILMALVPVAVALPVAAERAIRGPGSSRGGWAVVAGALAWFTVLAVPGQIRWAHYLHVLAPLGLASLLVRSFSTVRQAWSRPLARAAGEVGLVVVFFGWPLAVLAAQGRNAAGGGSPCSAADMVPTLSTMEGREGRRARVLAPLYWGPELIFRAGVDVVAGPFHRNDQGVLDSHRIMSARDPAQALTLVRERDLDYVVLCPGEDWMPHLERHDPGTLFHELARDRPPSWLRPIPLPATADAYRLYGVVPSDSSAPLP